MNRRWAWKLSGLAILLVTICIFARIFARTSYRSDNFPLKEKWSIHLRGELQAISSAGELVLARTTGALYALEKTTGAFKWSHKLSWQPDPKPAIARNGMVFVTDGKIMLAFKQEDGSILWSQPVSSSTAWVIDVSNNFVVIQEDQHFLVFEAQNGSPRSRIPFTCRGPVPAYLDDTSVYFLCQGIQTFDILSGTVKWAKKDERIGGYSGASDGIIYYSPSERTIEAFDTRMQMLVWQIPKTIYGFERFKVLAEILFYTDFEDFCALKQIDGQVIWCVKIPYPQNTTVMGDVVYIFNGNSTKITAVNLSNGEKIGALILKNFNSFSTYRELMTSSNEWLFFGSNQEVFAFVQPDNNISQ